MDNRYEIAEQNGMSREFADWFFDNKKDGCGNVWFMMMAAMWEGWQGRSAIQRSAENSESRCTIQTAPALDSSPKIAKSRCSNSPVIPDGLHTVCAEAYQVVGVMAEALGVFDDAAVQKVMDNLAQQKLVHCDVLPFSLPAAAQQEVE